jgi:hypothetical protein
MFQVGYTHFEPSLFLFITSSSRTIEGWTTPHYRFIRPIRKTTTEITTLIRMELASGK